MLLESGLKVRGWVLWVGWVLIPALIFIRVPHYWFSERFQIAMVMISYVVISDVLVFRQMNLAAEGRYRGGVFLRIKTGLFLLALMCAASSPHQLSYLPVWGWLVFVGGPILLALILPPLAAMGWMGSRQAGDPS